MAFCRNCGKPLATEAVICPGRGVPNTKGNAYCWNCGNGVSALAEICVKCGVKLNANRGKTKTTAIILSLFLSFWSWLYTYKRNAWKFWLVFGLHIIVGGIEIFLLIRDKGILDKATWGMSWSDYFAHYNNPAPYYFWAAVFVVIVWLWALLDNAIRKKDWYLRY